MKPDLIVIGGGLAGSEAAWQAAQLGRKVRLYEMRPDKMTPAHQSGDLAELVCSNSMRASSLENAVGLLKEEMRHMDSLIMRCADRHTVPAGGALAVDRESFAQEVTRSLSEHPNVEIVREEVANIPWIGVPVVIATGPLTSEALSTEIQKVTNTEALYFFDAAAPIIHRESIDDGKVFAASRYEKGGDDYINCPMNKNEYMAFWHELKTAKKNPMHHFENDRFFEGCMPVEELAKRGEKTLLFGPLKPVGLTNPHTGERPFAVVQLRQDDAAGRLFNMVGFQTRLKWPEQKRVFRMIPGLENAEFARYGVMHRNSYIDSPRFLQPTLQAKQAESLLFAGQLTGVEGYVESAANGLVAGINAARLSAGKAPLVFPPETAHGALCQYITSAVADTFQPMNITFGLMPDLEEPVRDRKERRQKLSERALAKVKELRAQNDADWQ